MFGMVTTTKTSQDHSPVLPADISATRATGASLPPKLVKGEDFTMSLGTIPPSPAGETMLLHVKPDPDPEMDSVPPPSAVTDESEEKDGAEGILKMSKSPSPPDDSTPAPSKSPSPRRTTKQGSSSNARKAPVPPPQLIGDLPIAREAAFITFTEIHFNNYQFKTLGRSREVLESMTCDCVYDPDVDEEDSACGSYSDCINRLTQVECLPEDCRCRSHCQNQRFQKRQYANIDIVQTEKKGFGLRAEADIPQDTFIYEYVGDVINPNTFKKRMQKYAEEGIQHFYFMMLQKDEFIDATKSGGIGRFANHSCNPNCYVAKWTVGTHVRMGIFSKRLIRKHEELTFNYNVDRYGHQAQTCWCGEPNCVGFIGGKTQTDVATMDDLYLDALGITDEDDVAELKGTKKKKGKKIDDPDFMPSVKPIVENEVPKVVQAIRQTTNRQVLYKLLTRIKITQDQAALRQIMRLRGYSVMKNVLDDYSTDFDLMELALQCLDAWPLLNRNKVDDSKVADPVEQLVNAERESIKLLAQKLLGHWRSLPLYNRIPKRALPVDELPKAPPPLIHPIDEQMKRRKQQEAINAENQRRAALKARNRRVLHEERSHQVAMLEKERQEQAMLLWEKQQEPQLPPLPVLDTAVQKHQSLIEAVIANATQAVAAQEKAAIEAREQKAKEEVEAAEKAAKRKARALAKKAMSKEEREGIKEKRLLKLIGAVVVKYMSKYAKGLQRDTFKKYAKELTQVIADKEKKSSSYKEGRLDTLSEEKTAKIKKFAKEYIAKMLRKLEKSGRRPSSHSISMSGTGASSSTHTQTPNSVDGGEFPMTGDITMSVEEAMDMDDDDDSGSESEHEDAGRGQRYGDCDRDGRESGNEPEAGPSSRPPSHSRSSPHHIDSRNGKSRDGDPRGAVAKEDPVSAAYREGRDHTPQPEFPQDQWGDGDAMDCDMYRVQSVF